MVDYCLNRNLQMANSCLTSYVIVGSPENIARLNDDLECLMEKDRSSNEQGTFLSDKNWIGYIVIEMLGKRWQDLYCRGTWSFDNLHKGELKISTVTAWEPCNMVFFMLAEKYEVDLYYLTEELGCGLYETNDSSFYYFDNEIVVSSEYETEYIQGRDNVISYINERMHTSFKSWDEIITNKDIEGSYSIFELTVV